MGGIVVQRWLGQRWVVLAGVGLLAACTSIPLSTLWRMRDLTVDSFFRNEPRDLRVAIRTDDRAKRGSGNPAIDIRVDFPARKPVCYAFSLVPVDAAAPREVSIEAAPTHRRWYAFGLSKAGIDAFERARREVRLEQTGAAHVDLRVTMNDVLDLPDGQASLPIRIDLALDRKDGCFTLIQETTVEPGNHRIASGDNRTTDAARPDAKDDRQRCPAVAS